MTQTQVSTYLSDKVGITKKQAKSAVEELTTLVVRELKREGSLRLAGLGIFRKRKTKARMGRNPATGQQIRDSGAHAAALHAGQGAEGFSPRRALSRCRLTWANGRTPFVPNGEARSRPRRCAFPSRSSPRAALTFARYSLHVDAPWCLRGSELHPLMENTDTTAM